VHWSEGLDPWVDFKDLSPGQRWKDELERAADAAEWFLILVGTDSRATPWQEAEWSAALSRTWQDRDKRVLPIVFGEASPPPFLRNWVALKVNSEAELSTWTRRVLSAVQNARKPSPDAQASTRDERCSRLDMLSEAAKNLSGEEELSSHASPRSSD
jgi:hypothetical protein